MLQVFGDLKRFVYSSGDKSKPDVEGWVARLHYKVTAGLLLVCSVLVTSIQYIGLGSHISCVQEGHPDTWPIPAHVMDTYCFIMSTFILPRHLEGRAGVGEKLYPGVGAERPGEERTYKAYYQWVPFVLFLQCCLFYIPHLVFKAWEQGKVGGIISGLHETEYLVEKEERLPRHRALARYFLENLNQHNFWAVKLYLSDILIFVNVVGNIYFIDTFLGGEFSMYGAQVISFIGEDPMVRLDPMTRVFPRMAKCTYRKFGASGTIQTHDALCLLPINVINEKVYVFLWFWLVALAVLSALSCIHQTAQALIPGIQAAFIKRKSRYRDSWSRVMEELREEMRLGDWKLLNILAYNMSPLVLEEFLSELGSQARGRREIIQADENETNANLRKPLLTPI